MVGKNQVLLLLPPLRPKCHASFAVQNNDLEYVDWVMLANYLFEVGGAS